jgi:hypothetical protein
MLNSKSRGWRGWAGAAIVVAAISVAAQAPTGAKAGTKAQEPVKPAVFKVAPMPTGLARAKTVFISNGGADSALFPRAFSGDPDRPYNEFYGDVASLGRFDVVNDPVQADLVLELRLTDTIDPTGKPNAMFQLAIYGARAHYILWTVTETVDVAKLQKSRDKNFDQALASLTQDLRRVTANAEAGETAQ